MTLARVKTWAAGDVLTAADLNAEFNNILNNSGSLIQPITLTQAMDFATFAANNMRVMRSTAVASTATTAGILQFVTGDGLLRIAIGTHGITPVGPFGNISRVSGLNGSLISNVGSFEAQGYVMQSTTTIPFTFGCTATSSYSINTQTAGPIINGKDQAAAFASTTVHFYAITSGIGSTAPQGIVSSNPPPTGPTMPTSYSAWAYLASAIYTVATSVLTNSSRINGNRVQFNAIQTALSSGFLTVETSVGVGSLIPQIAPSFRLNGRLWGGIGDGAGNLLVIHEVRAVTGVHHYEMDTAITGAAGVYSKTGAPIIDVPNRNTPPSFYYLNTINTGTSGAMTIDVMGYTVPNGDV